MNVNSSSSSSGSIFINIISTKSRSSIISIDMKVNGIMYNNTINTINFKKNL